MSPEIIFMLMDHLFTCPFKRCLMGTEVGDSKHLDLNGIFKKKICRLIKQDLWLWEVIMAPMITWVLREQSQNPIPDLGFLICHCLPVGPLHRKKKIQVCILFPAHLAFKKTWSFYSRGVCSLDFFQYREWIERVAAWYLCLAHCLLAYPACLMTGCVFSLPTRWR